MAAVMIGEGFAFYNGEKLSGLEAFAGHKGQLTQKDVAPIDQVILRYARVLFQGKVVRRNLLQFASVSEVKNVLKGAHMIFNRKYLSRQFKR